MLSRDFAIADICALMGVSRAGYYKWKHRKPSTRDINRESLVEAVKKVHDGDDINFRIELQKRVEQEPLNEGFTVRDIPGYSNYALPILSSTGNKEAAIVYGFDSNKDSSIQQVKGRNWITREQIKWYERMSEDYTKKNGGIPLPSYSFFHIPLPEFKIAYEDA